MIARDAHFALLAVCVLAVVACGGGSGPTPAGTPAVTLTVVVQDTAFDQSVLVVPADQPFAITLDNRDSVPHNLAIRSGKPGTTGETFTGPAQRTFIYAPLPAGDYNFVCDVHAEMNGTVQSR